MYEDYIKRCDKMLAEGKNDFDKTKRLQIIKEMLQIPNCFLYMSINTAINVFLDLGFTKEEAREQYIKVTELRK